MKLSTISILLLLLTLSTTTLASKKNPENLKKNLRILQFFKSTQSGFRFPVWLQVVTFIILILLILISIALIVLYSRNNAGPARLNPMVIQQLRMQGKLPNIGMGAGMMGMGVGMGNMNDMMMNRMKQMNALNSSGVNLNRGNDDSMMMMRGGGMGF